MLHVFTIRLNVLYTFMADYSCFCGEHFAPCVKLVLVYSDLMPVL